ncbi:MAG: hypothetical protein HRU19_18025 [Pseudobacteriovorax sp.]|nr:hypothetical protein [Pseudobacteriovorax sp.]
MKILSYLAVILLGLSTIKAVAFDAKIQKVDRAKNRILLSAESQYLETVAADDEYWAMDSDQRETLIKVLRVLDKNRFLAECTSPEQCQSFSLETINLRSLETPETEATFAEIKTSDKPVFTSHISGTEYSHSLAGVKDYIDQEVDQQSPKGSAFIKRYDSIKSREKLASTLSTPFYGLGILGGAIVLLAIPEDDDEDRDPLTKTQKRHVTQLLGWSLGSLLTGFIIDSSLSPKKTDINALIEDAKVGYRNVRIKPKSSINFALSPTISPDGEGAVNLGLSWRF